MKSLNKVILVGRIGSEIELRHIQNGDSVTNFSIATDESYTIDGKKIEKTEWHKCTAWKQTAETISQICHKGDTVLVEGKLQTRTWDKNGTKQLTTEIVVLNIIKFE